MHFSSNSIVIEYIGLRITTCFPLCNFPVEHIELLPCMWHRFTHLKTGSCTSRERLCEVVWTCSLSQKPRPVQEMSLSQLGTSSEPPDTDAQRGVSSLEMRASGSPFRVLVAPHSPSSLPGTDTSPEYLLGSPAQTESSPRPAPGTRHPAACPRRRGLSDSDSPNPDPTYSVRPFRGHRAAAPGKSKRGPSPPCPCAGHTSTPPVTAGREAGKNKWRQKRAPCPRRLPPRRRCPGPGRTPLLPSAPAPAPARRRAEVRPFRGAVPGVRRCPESPRGGRRRRLWVCSGDPCAAVPQPRRRGPASRVSAQIQRSRS